MKIITNWRYHVLALVGIVAVIGIFSEPQDGSLAYWVELVISKAVGFGAAYAFYSMMRLWYFNGSLPELNELMRED